MFESTISHIEKCAVVPVIALERVEDALPLADALVAGGLPLAEVTFRTAAAEASIKAMSKRSDILVGAGTVLNPDTVKRAVDAGARPVADARWFLDEMPYGGGHGPGPAPDWAPRPGTHVFELRDARGAVLDRARVIVRSGRFAVGPAGPGSGAAQAGGQAIGNHSDAQGKH